MRRRSRTAIVFVIVGWWIPVLWFPEKISSAEPAARAADIEVFTREGCARCLAAQRFLAELQHQRPQVRVVFHDVEKDHAALTRLQELVTRHGGRMLGVPAFLVREVLVVGYQGDTTGARLKALLDTSSEPLPQGNQTPAGVCAPDAALSCGAESTTPAGAEDAIEAPFFGRVSVRSLGLPLFTLVLGLLDGFNPCAMWVLLFLLSLLVNLQNRAKMLLIGGTFVLVSGAVYFAFMAAWLNVFLILGFSRTLQVLLGAVAVFVGLVNTKDFFAFGRGVSLSIPASAKPGIYDRVRRIIQAEDIAGALFSVIVLAVLVNMVELLCTAGFPAVYTHVLTRQQLPWWAYYGYLGLYNLAYMLDDSVLLLIAVVTLSRHKLQEREGRWLKLLSGCVMIALGVALLGKPEWLLW